MLYRFLSALQQNRAQSKILYLFYDKESNHFPTHSAEFSFQTFYFQTRKSGVRRYFQTRKWGNHIVYIALKISRNIGIISRLRQVHFVPLKTLPSIYISYGLKTHLEKLLILQKSMAVRLINFLPFRTHAIPYFTQSNILPITMLYFKLSAILMLDITTNSASQNICNLFNSTKDILCKGYRPEARGYVRGYVCCPRAQPEGNTRGE